MQIIFSRSAPGTDQADLFVRGVFESKEDLARALRAHEAALGKHLAAHVKEDGFSGKDGETLAMHTHGKLSAGKIALLGLGAAKGFDAERLRKAAGSALKLANAAKARRLAIVLPFSDAQALRAMLEGFLLADYGFKRYKAAKKDEKRVEEIIISVRPALKDAALKEAERLARATAEASNFARDLVNTPSLDMTPAHIMEEAVKLAAAAPKRIKIKTFDRKALAEMGCGGILAVNQGSEQEPYMLHLTYRPAKKAKKRIVLVGKGVTFDSGGLSLKPSEAMMDMKIDMAGAAAVLGVFKALPSLLPDVEVHGIAALVENMPSGKAIRPGDIVRTMSGKTIEILNTDAEGRVTLADTLFYGSKLKPDAMIDLATLTGACMVALGQDFAGLMSNDERLTKRLEDASKATGEPVWELPLHPAYGELVKSKHADLKNISGSRYGGAINAGMFLKEFVGETSWTHLDIAGPAYEEKDGPGYKSWGASGFGVRLLLEYLRNL